MEKENDVVIAARLVAHSALIQNLVRTWGSSPEELLQQLSRTREALRVSGINQARSDAFLHHVDVEFDMAIGAIKSLIQGLPDDRPDPIG